MQEQSHTGYLRPTASSNAAAGPSLNSFYIPVTDASRPVWTDRDAWKLSHWSVHPVLAPSNVWSTRHPQHARRAFFPVHKNISHQLQRSMRDDSAWSSTATAADAAQAPSLALLSDSLLHALGYPGFGPAGPSPSVSAGATPRRTAQSLRPGPPGPVMLSPGAGPGGGGGGLYHESEMRAPLYSSFHPSQCFQEPPCMSLARRPTPPHASHREDTQQSARRPNSSRGGSGDHHRMLRRARGTEAVTVALRPRAPSAPATARPARPVAPELARETVESATVAEPPARPPRPPAVRRPLPPAPPASIQQPSLESVLPLSHTPAPALELSEPRVSLTDQPSRPLSPSAYSTPSADHSDAGSEESQGEPPSPPVALVRTQSTLLREVMPSLTQRSRREARHAARAYAIYNPTD